MDDPVTRATEYAAERSLNHDWESLGEKGVAINGLLSAGGEEADDVARQVVDHAVQTQTADGNLSYDFIGSQSWDDVVTRWTGQGGFTSNIGPALVGQGVLEFYERTGEERYLEAARRQYGALQSVDRTEDGGIPTRRERTELWIDSIYMTTPFLSRYAVLDDEPAAFDDAVRQIRVHADHLHDEATGVFRHIWCETPDTYPDSALWARGNGWMIAGVADTLGYLPEDHDDREWLEGFFRDHAAGLLDFRDDSGLWRNVLDDPLSPLEVSSACQYAYAYRKGVDMGLLDAEYAAVAEESMDVACGFVGADGEVKRVALTPGGPGAPIGGGSHGQGWFLIAAGYVLD